MNWVSKDNGGWGSQLTIYGECRPLQNTHVSMAVRYSEVDHHVTHKHTGWGSQLTVEGGVHSCYTKDNGRWGSQPLTLDIQGEKQACLWSERKRIKLYFGVRCL